MTLGRGPLGLAFLVALGACGGGSGEEESPTPVVTAVVAVARVEPFEATIPVLGVATPQAGRFAELAAPAEARVARIWVSVGDAVAVGDPLIAFDRTIWEAEARRAASEAEAARRAYARASTLAEQGIVARKEIETAAADLARAEADLADARRTLSLAVLRSPIAGVVTRMDARLDATVDSSMPVVEVVDPSGLEIVFRLSPDDAARVHRGATVRLEGDAVGRVAGIDAAIDSTGNVGVRARLAGGGPPLRVGQSVAGRIVAEVHPRAVVVPAEAVVPAAGDSLRVFVVGADSTAHARPVTVAARGDELVEIGTGLRGGERVVADGAYGVVEGAQIREGAP